MPAPLKLNEAASKTIWNWILEDGIKPHAEAIARIVDTGAIACVMLDVHEACMDLANGLGYDGTSLVFPMDEFERQRFTQGLALMNDQVSVDWMTREAKNRIFLMVELGTYLLNITPTGIAVEPGSTDNPELDFEAVKHTMGIH